MRKTFLPSPFSDLIHEGLQSFSLDSTVPYAKTPGLKRQIKSACLGRKHYQKSFCNTYRIFDCLYGNYISTKVNITFQEAKSTQYSLKYCHWLQQGKNITYSLCRCWLKDCDTILSEQQALLKAVKHRGVANASVFWLQWHVVHSSRTQG